MSKNGHYALKSFCVIQSFLPLQEVQPTSVCHQYQAQATSTMLGTPTQLLALPYALLTHGQQVY